MILELGLTGTDPVETERVLQAIADAYLRQNVGRSLPKPTAALPSSKASCPKPRRRSARPRPRSTTTGKRNRRLDLGFEGQNLLTQISALEAELQQLADREDELAERYTPDHPLYQHAWARAPRTDAPRRCWTCPRRSAWSST